MTAEPFVFEQHCFTRTVCSWRYCSKCGLVSLRNPFTEWCIKVGCNSEDHPSYRSKLRTLTGSLQ